MFAKVGPVLPRRLGQLRLHPVLPKERLTITPSLRRLQPRHPNSPRGSRRPLGGEGRGEGAKTS